MDFRAQAETLLDELYAKHPMSYRPRIIWKAMRVSAGMAYYRLGAIGLSSRVLDTEEKMRSTLIHEYAHLLAVHRHGRKAANHGPHWQITMRELGAEPVVRHRYDVERNKPRQKVEYRCQRCGKLIERSRRLPRRRKYVHALCGGSLKLHAVSKIAVTNVILPASAQQGQP